MSIVKEFLQQKDGDYQQYVPNSYKLSAEDKAKALLVHSIRSRFEYEHAAKCIKPCFKTMTSPVVTESESECMTNCVSKGFETLSHLQLFYARSA